MRRTKKMLALLLAGVLTFSNVAYAAPGDGGSAPTENEAETDISIPKNEGAEALEMGSETDPEDEVKDLETDPEGEVTDLETDPEGEVTDPETDPEGEVTDPETDPEGEVTDPETDPEGEVTDPETDPEDEVKDPETDPEDEVKDPETDPEDEGKDPEVVDDVDAAGAAEEDPENPDADAAEEVTEDEEESEEAATYKITFAEEPESHGTLLTIDDEEIGEEGIETDEEGYAQFKVQADEGWTAEAVCGDEVLSLVEDSYYEVQVSEDTEVTVSYQEVAVEEEPLPEVVEEPEAVTEDEELEAPKMKLSVAMLKAEPRATVSVTINKEGDEPVGGSISTGYIENNIESYDGFKFEDATVDGKVIVYVGVYEGVTADEPIIYYSIDGESAERLGNKQIILNYSKIPSKITYQFNSNLGTVEGPESAKAGEQVTFTANASLGNEITSIKINGVEQEISSGQTSFTFLMGKDETIVDVQFEAQNEFDITYSGILNSDDYLILEECSMPATVANGSTLVATLRIPYEWSSLEQDHKLFHIRINGQIIEMDGNSGSYSFDGMDISVTFERSYVAFQGWRQTYTITVTNVRQDLDIGYFVKSTDATSGKYDSTISVMGLDGVTLYVWNDDSKALELASLGDSFILPRNNSMKYFYVKAKPGYVATLSNAGGAGMRIISPISADTPGAAEAMEQGCLYEFHYTKSLVNNEPNRTIYLGCEPIQYKVEYQGNGGTPVPTDDKSYTIENGTIIIGDEEPVLQGKVFTGWKLGDQPYQLGDPLYQKGDTIIVDENSIELATADNIFVLSAQWVNEGEETIAAFTVEHYYEDENGGFPKEADIVQRLKGTIGGSAMAMEKARDGYIVDTTLSSKTWEGIITADGNLVLKLYYRKDTNNNNIPDSCEVEITFQSVKGTFDDGQADYTVIGGLKNAEGKWDPEGEYTLKAEDIHAVGSAPDAGYKAGAWDVEPTTETVVTKETAFTYTYVEDESQWATIEFNIGVHGKTENQTKFKVLKNTEFDKSVTVPAVTAEKGWIFNGWDQKFPDNVTVDETFNAEYLEDKDEDGIPDNCEVTITFKAVKGTFDDGQADYTVIGGLKNAEGKWDPEGEYTLKAEDIHAVGSAPDAGYKAGAWDVEPTTETVVTKETAFTYRYVKDESQWHWLSYYGNGSTSGEVPNAKEYIREEVVTLAGKGTLERENAAFLGWSETQYLLLTNKAEVEDAEIIETLTMPDNDVIVYAVWASDENNNGEPDYKEDLVNITFDVVDTTKGYFETAGRRTITVELLPGIALPTPSSFVDVEGDEWTLDGWMYNGQEVTVVPKTSITVTANWAEDKNQNNEPDVDEEWVSITFDAVDTARGYFGNGEQTRTFEMLPGAPLLSPAGFVDVLGDNWTLDYWTLNGQEVTVVPDTNATVLAHWAEDKNHNNQPDEDESYSLTITYAYAQGEEGSAALPAVNRQNDLAVGHAYSVASPEIEGYVAEPAVVSGTISDRDVSATVLYYIDSNGNDVPDSQEPDDGGNGGGGGSSDEDDDDGGSGGTGGGTTGGGTAADTTTGTGTTPGAGTGAAPAPVTTVTIAADDADAADTADDADAAEGADEDYALEEVGEDTENAAEDEESVATINEDETPLANQQIHSPVCILHWLILLAALIIAVIFIWDGHNRKKRIEELKKELGMK